MIYQILIYLIFIIKLHLNLFGMNSYVSLLRIAKEIGEFLGFAEEYFETQESFSKVKHSRNIRKQYGFKKVLMRM